MDITEEKRAQERLRESETWYRTLFETTGAATMILEEDTTISLVNREFVQQFGYTREETENRKSWTEFIAPEDLGRMRKYHHLRRIDPEGPPKNYEFRFISNTGEARNVYLTVDIIPGTCKSIASLVDITDLRRADETLKVRGRELENKTIELEELNAALRVLLKRREEDRNELEEKVLSNVKKLVLPYIEKLKKGPLDPMTRTSILILESNLRDIIAPFSTKLSSIHMNLTPRELQVANLIKEGKSTKEIAEFLNVSPSAVNICRYRIRHKLGLNNRKINLQTYLSQLV
jgi:PAS domain S-box-containing protein